MLYHIASGATSIRLGVITYSVAAEASDDTDGNWGAGAILLHVGRGRPPDVGLTLALSGAC